MSLPRTNNSVEGWHRAFNGRFRKANMSLSQFITRLKDEEQKTWHLIARFLYIFLTYFCTYFSHKSKIIFLRNEIYPANPLRGRNRRKEASNRDDQIKMICIEYLNIQNAQRDTLRFCRNIQHHIAKFSF